MQCASAVVARELEEQQARRLAVDILLPVSDGKKLAARSGSVAVVTTGVGGSMVVCSASVVLRW